MSRTGIVVQARMGSTRLPGKVLLDLEGAPVLVRLFERLRLVEGAPQIILATSELRNDDPIAKIVESQPGIGLWRGSEQDVLERYRDAARYFDLDPVVRVTADNPLTEPSIIKEVLAFFRATPNCDYADNLHPRTVPYGLGIQVASRHALERACAEAHKEFDREHVFPYILGHPQEFRCAFFPAADFRGADLRLTLDYPEDLALIRGIYERLYHAKPAFDLDDVLELRRRDPAIFDLNRNRVICG